MTQSERNAAASNASVSAERIARESYGRLLAHLATKWRDVASAEDALAEAFEAALTNWSERGVPENPIAWLATVARRKLLDQARRRRVATESEEHVIRQIEELTSNEPESLAIPDRRLGLMFACAHPAVDPNIRAPLMMQTVLGIDAAHIASAFLVPPATMGQRLSRAKTKIRDAGIPFVVPDADDLGERIGWILEALYGAFAIANDEAFAEDPFGRGLADEAIWLGRVVVNLTDGEPEPLGLLALFLFIHARRAARRDAYGRYIPLSEQLPAHWDDTLVSEAEALLFDAAEKKSVGRFQLEAAIQSAHCARRRGIAVAWAAIAKLYERLGDFSNSRVVEVNRAIAVANADCLAKALALIASIESEGDLAEFQPFWAAKAELHARAGLKDSARAAYDRAIGLERDPAVRDFLQNKRLLIPE